MESPASNEPLPQYAPMYYGSSKNLNLDEEVRLFTNNKERDKYDNMADLYALIVLMEHLEKAFIRDSITAEEYTPQCANLIAKYKTTMNFLSDSVTSLETFMNDYKLTCPAAVNRFKIGVPATYEHAVGSSSKQDVGKSAKLIADIVSCFITLQDALRLNRLAVDELHPLLAELIQALNKDPELPADFEGRSKVRKWLITLHAMKASDEITDEQKRQMLFEIEQAHSEFYRLLSGEQKVSTDTGPI